MNDSRTVNSALKFIYFIKDCKLDFQHANCIPWLLNVLLTRFVTHFPNLDFFSRRYGSALTINEDSINTSKYQFIISQFKIKFYYHLSNHHQRK